MSAAARYEAAVRQGGIIAKPSNNTPTLRGLYQNTHFPVLLFQPLLMALHIYDVPIRPESR